MQPVSSVDLTFSNVSGWGEPKLSAAPSHGTKAEPTSSDSSGDNNKLKSSAASSHEAETETTSPDLSGDNSKLEPSAASSHEAEADTP